MQVERCLDSGQLRGLSMAEHAQDHFQRATARRTQHRRWLMTTIHSILVATDFSPGANAGVERAVDLARAHHASLRLVHAFDVSLWNSLKSVFDAAGLSAQPPSDVQMRQRVIDAATTLAHRTGLVVDAEFGAGSPQRLIEAAVRQHASSLVVVGSRADPELQGLGSTASKLVRTPPCPVLVVRTEGTTPYEKVMCAVDLREGSVRAAGFALKLLPSAHHHLLYALDPGVDRSFWVGGLGTAQAQAMHESLHEHAERALQQLARSLRDLSPHPLAAEVADDAPARAILVRAAELAADCVVVGHHGEGPATDHLLGSMAQHAIQYTTRDVLVVP